MNGAAILAALGANDQNTSQDGHSFYEDIPSLSVSAYSEKRLSDLRNVDLIKSIIKEAPSDAFIILEELGHHYECSIITISEESNKVQILKGLLFVSVSPSQFSEILNNFALQEIESDDSPGYTHDYFWSLRIWDGAKFHEAVLGRQVGRVPISATRGYADGDMDNRLFWSYMYAQLFDSFLSNLRKSFDTIK